MIAINNYHKLGVKQQGFGVDSITNNLFDLNMFILLKVAKKGKTQIFWDLNMVQYLLTTNVTYLTANLTIYDIQSQSLALCYVMLYLQVGVACSAYTVNSRYREVVGTIFYKFKLPEVQINLHFGNLNL